MILRCLINVYPWHCSCECIGCVDEVSCSYVIKGEPSLWAIFKSTTASTSTQHYFEEEQGLIGLYSIKRSTQHYFEEEPSSMSNGIAVMIAVFALILLMGTLFCSYKVICHLYMRNTERSMYHFAGNHAVIELK